MTENNESQTDGAEQTPAELTDWLSESPSTRALRVAEGGDPLGPRFYAIINGQLTHHPGVADDGRELGVVGPTSRGKLSFDMAECDVEKVDVSDTPFRPADTETEGN